MTGGRPLHRALTVFVGLALAFARAGPAAASGPGLAGSDPADRAALATAPAAVELVFSAPTNVDLSHVVVLDDGGSSTNAGGLTYPGPGTLRQPVTIQRPGTFTVAYHVTFSDGIESHGLLRFSVGTGAPPPPLDPAAATRAGEAAAAEHPHSIDPLSALLLVVNGVVIAVVVVLLLRRPRQAD